jgi:thioredoxin reductase (NADPH)
MEEYDVAIVGGGPGGMTASIYASRRGLKTVMFERAVVGGEMALTERIENYPGFSSISGAELAEKMKEQAHKLGATMLLEEVVSIKKKDGGFLLTTGQGGRKAKAVILATGTEYRKLDIPGEKEFAGKGVSFCATCDAPFFKDRKVAVVGGGNTAISSALVLSDVASTVYVIHRRSDFRGDELLVNELKKRKNVTLILDSVVTAIGGKGAVEWIELENVKTEKREKMDVDGVFINVGLVPSASLANELGAKLADDGHIKVDEGMRTNVEGLFAAGDVTGGLAQIATAVGKGATAAISAYAFIKKVEGAEKIIYH